MSLDRLFIGGLLLPIAMATAGEGGQQADLASRRQAIFEIARTQPADGIARLASALNDENAVIRRTAARCLADGSGDEALKVLEQALNHADEEVRLCAFSALHVAKRLRPEHLAAALTATNNLALRLMAVEVIAQGPDSDAQRKLLEIANRDADETVRTIAARKLYPFPFTREMRSVRWNADQVVNVIRDVTLPKEGWKLCFDSQQQGHVLGWQKPDFDDRTWQSVNIGYWDQFGHPGHQEIGWYRGTFELTERPDHQAAELVFETVAGSAWVWINGVYAGQRLAGIEDWNAPFSVDVTPFVKWGETNHIAVRVQSLARIGGIAKPIRLEVIKLGAP